MVLTILDDDDGENNTANGAKNDPGNDSCGNLDMVTFQTALGRTVRATVSAPHLTWEMATRVLERPLRCSRASAVVADPKICHNPKN